MQTILIRFDRLPPTPLLLARSLLPKKRRTSDALPRLEATVSGVQVDAVTLRAYREVCGFKRGDSLPLTYPQVLASPLHLAVFSHPGFPFAPLGIVHVRSEIEQRRLIGAGERLDLRCWTEGLREVRGGLEFDLVTTASVNAEVVWRSVTTILRRQPGKTPRRDEPRRMELVEPPGAVRSQEWRIGESTGRRYARVSGDYNPIHLYAATARLFGFPRAIAHGMWSLARCVAELEELRAPGPARLEASFRRPVLLPSSVRFSVREEDGRLAFAVRGQDGAQTYLSGSLGPRF